MIPKFENCVFYALFPTVSQFFSNRVRSEKSNTRKSISCFPLSPFEKKQGKEESSGFPVGDVEVQHASSTPRVDLSAG